MRAIAPELASVAGKQDDVIIAEPGFKWVSKWQVGKPYVIVKYYNGDDQLVGIYCDVCRPVKQTEDGLEYEDLYLDVWMAACSKEPVILDENELREAFEQGFLNKADVGFARSVALVLVEKLKNNGPELQF